VRGRVVDEEIESAQLFGGVFDDILAVRAPGQVAGQRECAAAGVLDPSRGLDRVVVLVVVGDRDVGALTRERDRDGAPDAARRSVFGAGGTSSPPFPSLAFPSSFADSGPTPFPHCTV